MKNVVPFPVSVSKCSEPLSFSTTMPRDSARPWPVPRPTSLVVKNGSKMRPRTASGMPSPVSADRDLDEIADARASAR